VWDIRTKTQVHCLSGHEDTVSAILAMPTDPQVSGAVLLFVFSATPSVMLCKDDVQ
jgi:hypothetical protein